MRSHIVLVSAAMTLALAVGADARDRNLDAPHVRALNDVSRALVADAQQKSATVRDLLNSLETSNLVAYVYVTPLAKNTPESGLNFLGSSKAQRFVLIRIADDSNAGRRVELLGHELQHAVEVASRTWVRDDIDFQRLISSVGWRDDTRARGYETTAATVAESRVRRDVRSAGHPAQ
jgi:hypothetical protein